ncbi:MAG TPA: 16S rRNA (cytidine(1402)-2'-O)-methyltransferase [Pyrinomonadaceae bacterium]|nr:16S rRNA (cytidine(1402)-2'-O)-methyltransferase [Pyrinomonadaceae bacterium]
MAGTLYIVSTPIGNLEDITQRALRTLREVELVACEDTRHTRKLLNHFAIDVATISYHEHNERERADELCTMLAAGKNIAIVSDAGTPIVSDPGFRVVNLAIEKGFRVVPIPGATAFVAALSASGLRSDQFLFAGFLPPRASARRARLEELRAIPATLIFYEAPHRIAATLRDAADILGNRHTVLAREITKLHEEFMRGRLVELAGHFSDSHKARGEIVLLIAGPESGSDIDPGPETVPASQALAERVSSLEREGLNEKTALKKAARELGLKRDEAYRLMLTQKNRRSK